MGEEGEAVWAPGVSQAALDLDLVEGAEGLGVEEGTAPDFGLSIEAK